MPVPRPQPDDMPRSYRDAYWSNWWRMLTKRPVDTSLRGKCVGCGKPGVLGKDLIHRGMPLRTTNLLCKDCCEDVTDGKGDQT